MIEMDEVGELMRGDVVNERERRLHQAPVEAYMALPGATAPLRLRIGQGETAGRSPQPARETRETPGQQTLRTGQQPATHQFIGIRVQRRIDPQRLAVSAYLLKERGADIELQSAPHVVQPVHRGRLRLPTLRMHARPGAMQPVTLLPHIVFDLGTRGPARRVDAHFVRGDRQAQCATAARAPQLEGNGGVTDLKNTAIGAR